MIVDSNVGVVDLNVPTLCRLGRICSLALELLNENITDRFRRRKMLIANQKVDEIIIESVLVELDRGGVAATEPLACAACTSKMLLNSVEASAVSRKLTCSSFHVAVCVSLCAYAPSHWYPKPSS